MAGVSLINSLRKNWCMGLPSRGSGWKEKSQPECTVPFLCGLFLAILSPFVQQMRFWWIFPEAAVCLIISQRVFIRGWGGWMTLPETAVWRFPPGCGESLQPLSPLTSPYIHCSHSPLGNQHLPTEPRYTFTECPLCAVYEYGNRWAALRPDLWPWGNYLNPLCLRF